MGIVCRPVLLHNEFVPAKTGKRDWDYRMFGHQDGMTVGDCILFHNASNYVELFDVCQSYEKERHDYFTQILFGFHTDVDKESAFWEDDKPFLYITLLQFCNNNIKKLVNYFENGDFCQNSLENIGYPGSADDVNILVYSSLDNSDLILMIKCAHARIGEMLINSLHQNANIHPCKIRNSYSMLGVRTNDIKADGKLANEEETIDFLELRIVEKKSNSVGALHTELKKHFAMVKSKAEVERMLTLGTEDETIIIKNAMWKDLIACYRDETGILCNSNPEAAKYSNTISAKIMLSVKDTGNYTYDFEPETGKLFCDVLGERLKEVYDNRCDEKSKTEQKNLMQVINALWRFEYSYRTEPVFSDYNFYSMYMPLYTLIDLLHSSKNTQDKSYYEFMMCIKLRTQNFVKPDRVYTQMTDFNIRYFDIPAKLIVLYSAYVYYLKKVLNTDPYINYEFLISPGVTDTTRVMELFCMASETSRLMLIKLPERQTYNIKLMFIILCHETAHYVGRTVRMRQERTRHMIHICGRMITLAMKSYIETRSGDDKWIFIKENWDAAEDKLKDWLAYYLARETDEKYVKIKYGDDMVRSIQASEDNDDNCYNRTDVLEKTLNAVIDEMLRSKGETIFRFAIWDQYQQDKQNIKDMDWEAYCETENNLLKKCLNEFLGERDRQDDSLNVRNAIGTVLYLLKECYADVICILTLQLSVRDYLSAIKENINASMWSIEEASETILIPRIALVMQSIHEPLDVNRKTSGYFRWTDTEFNYSAEEEPEIYCLESAARRFSYKYMGEENLNGFINTENGASVVYDRTILLEILSYLKKCQETFYSLGICDEKLSHVRRFYALTEERDGNEAFEKYMDLLKKYEEDVYADICQIIKGELF